MGTATSAGEAVGGWEPDGTFEPQVSADEAGSRMDAWRSVTDSVAAL
jgi:hypothetical protein